FAYIFANGSEASSADGFDDRFFLLPELSQTGEWFNFHRNLHSDMVTLYGDEPDLGLSSISIIVESRSGGRIEFLLDDVYLYNDVAPEIANIKQTPAMPEYHEDVTVTADIIDSNPDNITLHYRMNSGAWNNVSMNIASGNTFSGTIPAQAFDDVVEYFISAIDIAGKTDVGLDGGVYFSYTSVDNVPPSVIITAPLNESTVHGIQEIAVTASDPGSGIDYVEFIIDSVSMENDTTSSFSYSWNTVGYADGEHTIVVKAIDFEGNENSVMIIVDVTSDVTSTTSPPPADNTLLLIVGIVGAIVVIVVIVVVQKKRQSS
ncbi:MAG: Ig-like domain-containing protein, partial [Candidatus Thorarchaeota archaeon]